MAKNLKLNIKNAQIAEAINLGSLKQKLAERSSAPAEGDSKKKGGKEVGAAEEERLKEEQQPRVKARSRSAFAEPTAEKPREKEDVELEAASPIVKPLPWVEDEDEQKSSAVKSSKELRREIFGDETALAASDTPTIAEIMADLPKPHSDIPARLSPPPLYPSLFLANPKPSPQILWKPLLFPARH